MSWFPEAFFQGLADAFAERRLDDIIKALAIPAMVFVDDRILAIRSIEQAEAVLGMHHARVFQMGMTNCESRVRDCVFHDERRAKVALTTTHVDNTGQAIRVCEWTAYCLMLKNEWRITMTEAETGNDEPFLDGMPFV